MITLMVQGNCAEHFSCFDIFIQWTICPLYKLLETEFPRGIHPKRINKVESKSIYLNLCHITSHWMVCFVLP